MRRFPLLFVLACACASTSPRDETARDGRAKSAASAISGSTAPTASALLEARNGGAVSGNANLTAIGNDDVGVHLEVHGAPPGRHGVSIADKGDCAANSGQHYNPNRGAHHGGPATPVRHAGDLGNIEVDSSGNGVLDVVVADLSIGSVANGVANRALVVSERPDDLQTEPDGGAGGRIACGLILAPMIGQP